MSPAAMAVVVAMTAMVPTIAMLTGCGYNCVVRSYASVDLHGDFGSGPVTILADDGRESLTCELDTNRSCAGNWTTACGPPGADDDHLQVDCVTIDGELLVRIGVPGTPPVVDVRITRGDRVLADRHVVMHYDPCAQAYEDVDF